MGDTLTQIGWKLDRAKEHIQALYNISDAFLGSPLSSLSCDEDRNGRRLILRIKEVRSIPPDYPLMIGEAVHQMRSALDHIAFALSKPSTAKTEERIKFPLCSSSKKFKDQMGTSLKGASRDVIRAVERVQPYHRKKWPDTRLLGQLQALNNWDKHRTLAVAVASIHESAVTLEVEGGPVRILREERFRGPLKANKIVARFEIAEPLGETKVYPGLHLVLSPVFDVGSPKQLIGVQIPPYLARVHEFIWTGVLPLFEPFFQ